MWHQLSSKSMPGALISEQRLVNDACSGRRPLQGVSSPIDPQEPNGVDPDSCQIHRCGGRRLSVGQSRGPLGFSGHFARREELDSIAAKVDLDSEGVEAARSSGALVALSGRGDACMQRVRYAKRLARSPSSLSWL